MKQSLYISIVVAMQLLATMLTQLLVIRMIGVGLDTDAYIAAQAVPAVLMSIITSALQSVWLPRLAVLSGDIKAWRQEQSIAQGQAGILGGGLFLLAGISMFLWLPLLYPGFSLQQQQTAMNFCLIMLLAAAFNSQSALLTIALRARNRFLAAELTALLGTILSLIAMYFFLPVLGLMAAVWIALARAVLVYIVQLGLANWPPLSFIKGWHYKNTWILIQPLLFGASIYKTSPLVDRYWASLAPVGGITTMSLAQTVMGALGTILERSISIPITPRLARYVAVGDYGGLRSAYRKGVFRITIAVLLLGALLLVLKPFFLESIRFIINIETETASALWLMCCLLLGYLHVIASGILATAAFYAMGNTKTPVKISMTGFIVSIGIKYIGFLLFSLPGLVFATSTYYILNMLIMCFLLEKTINEKIS